jgi:hypothetical protein
MRAEGGARRFEGISEAVMLRRPWPRRDCRSESSRVAELFGHRVMVFWSASGRSIHWSVAIAFHALCSMNGFFGSGEQKIVLLVAV